MHAKKTSLHTLAALPKSFQRENLDKIIGHFRSRKQKRHKARTFLIEVRTKSNLLRRMNCA
jgi:hypothetical protein